MKNKDGVPLVTGDGESVIIEQPHMLSCSTTFTPFNSETSSPLEVEIHEPRNNPDTIEGTLAHFSTINRTRVYPLGGSGMPLTIYVNDSTGAANLDGFQRGAPTTLDGALQWISNNPHITNWIVSLKDGLTHKISKAYMLTGRRILFERDFSGSTPATMTMTTPLTLDGATIGVQNLRISGYTSPAFQVRGVVNFELTAASIAIPAGGVIWECAPATTARIIATGDRPNIAFGAAAGLCSGGATPGYLNYEDSFSGSVITGTPALEAGTRGKVKKIASNIV
jgi:hypothetical protein